MQTITISGLDGSGKSTQVARLRDRFEAEGKRVHYFHAIHFSIVRLRHRLTGKRAHDAAEQPAVTTAGRTTIALRKAVLRIDLVRYRLLLRSLSRQGVDVLLSDRYYYDNLVNIAYLERSTRFVAVRPPVPDHAFYLRVDPAALMRRERPPEQGLDYLVVKHALYDEIASGFGLTVIDGSAGPDAVEAAIRAEL